MTESWLIDKSALVRLGSSVDAEAWANRIERGLVAITTVTLVEAGFSARSAGDVGRALGSAPLASIPVEYLTPSAEDRTVEVQRLLAERGQDGARSISTRTSTSSPTSPANQWSVSASNEHAPALNAALPGDPPRPDSGHDRAKVRTAHRRWRRPGPSSSAGAQ